MNQTVTPAEMQLGDVVAPTNADDSDEWPFSSATVIEIDDDNAHLFRPYIHHGNFAYGTVTPGQGKVIPYIGAETYKVWRQDRRPFRLLHREATPIL